MQSTEIKEKIKNLSESNLQELIDIRRHLHKIPELGFEENQTAVFIEKKLSEYNIPYKTGIAKTGIVGTIAGTKGDGKTIALRADMDALPIIEENDLDYKSGNAGVMHACGHDAHMACLLGAAKILNEFKNEFGGTIKLFFQPSEENFPGGALAMIDEGVLENPEVKNVFGQHVLPQLDAGKIGLKPGNYMASTDEIYITVKGKGGHAATPELYINPVMIAAEILVELDKEFKKNKPSECPSVLAFGRIRGEGRTNIIPDEVKIEGTLRTFSEGWRAEAHEMIINIADSISKKMNGKCDVHIAKGYPVLVNDDQLTANVKQLAIDFLGKENVVDLEMRMTAEDFAYFSQKVPSCFYRLGIRNEKKGIISNLHTSTFNIDESSLQTGAGLMSWIAINQLK
jgi:amidohydrolase